ncbi:MAG: bifunctional demethylmenaquinone methyltransferase/2-methoxy-6-polyprenyl-1,4-benzoquinol methylase UbiE [Sulfuricurvum sp.]|uniref:bifunctional demethylmenaquinone methyltransferase/2-methoxy-6-polyprenyl-1,4-benzoquinol methylase UbiE n=1 Tax=Sulfuricurvum sp. TaxID=2025608 RepID=UPI00260D9D6E|nr:bifunctional demethylmenaquinone methyltransferase/2-methoxy-6-polyprenyl-1,4-benzoquinol methylase UbiE [Sulfuricurvum sp.]MDD2829967.1 bifunctional demethylmenaquinone methyltransferase/2-methoxy-6-polyprenyl-1,4-benzoquinol methylase UbiE [Sulfuricurvum sp.]MDD4949072.1 bifunctional demethylmenaquinone methyltransferase/2-methoxy-6-polyprenyl-1,4-benzoquinol methylase UbiE [Sulfuricurvum sp.]
MTKQEKIVSMFNDIAPTYDRANRVLSMGVDTFWRRKACDLAFGYCATKNIDSIVDVACGTGDMMGYWKRRADKAGITVSEIVGVDPSEGMVGVGREKFPKMTFHIAPATALPESDTTADIISISYGIRNVVERQAGLREFNRVLKSGGLVVILEFMKNENPSLLGKVRDWYMNNVLPRIGGLISNNYEAYRYLPDSIEGFLTVAKMRAELEEAGFEMLYTKSFSMDISTLMIARKK